MELWMLPVLFGLEGELMALHQWFRVFLVVSAVPGCGVLIFIIGPPFYQCFTMLLIVAMSFQLRIRDNRGRGSAPGARGRWAGAGCSWTGSRRRNAAWGLGDRLLSLLLPTPSR
ncbi:KH homology domain-containing protein 1-like isoform X3 [Camelus bactrianus]|uniref:KH homology domain-containing protein 1-like isoform X3 n=1 Tax=Camelus bactrianus TaxID=9837 RepID=A0AC58P7P8_CAMBA